MSDPKDHPWHYHSHGRAIDIVAADHNSHLHIGNFPPLTPEENAEWEARKESARLRKGEVLATLAAVTDPILRALIDHHARDTEDSYWSRNCQGCDQGCSCDAPPWPCSTIVTICEGLGVDMTDMDGEMDLANWRADT